MVGTLKKTHLFILHLWIFIMLGIEHRLFTNTRLTMWSVAYLPNLADEPFLWLVVIYTPALHSITNLIWPWACFQQCWSPDHCLPSDSCCLSFSSFTAEANAPFISIDVRSADQREGAHACLCDKNKCVYTSSLLLDEEKNENVFINHEDAWRGWEIKLYDKPSNLCRINKNMKN